MSAYKHILMAIDLTEETEEIAAKANTLAHAQSAKLSIIHVIEPINFAYGGDIPMDLTAIQEQLDQHAKNKLAHFADRYNIPDDQQHVIIGIPQNEIHRVAEEQGVDLVVVGSHGRHGLSLLLGSTANGVLHGAGCDVLAVRIQESE